jgi:hypothetical protein
MDNLAANKTPAIRRWASCENAGLCFTPRERILRLDRIRESLRHPAITRIRRNVFTEAYLRRRESTVRLGSTD